MEHNGHRVRRPPRRPWSRKAGLYFLIFALAIFTLSAGVFTRHASPASFRSTDLASIAEKPQCQDIKHAKDQCAFFKQYCGDEDEGLLSYLGLYYCRLNHAKPAAMVVLLLWLAVLLLSIGITAGDFFSINLSSIASGLSMSDTFAGVTFLALGNGSPDLFSTFAAMNSNSSMMAIGELVGAAAFITTVVAGSMAFIKPFHIKRDPFLRDIAFLLAAVLLLLFVLVRGELRIWECVAMVVLYIVYVVLVVFYHWWLARRKQQHNPDPVETEDGHANYIDHERDPLLQQQVRNSVEAAEDEDDETGHEDTAKTYAAMSGRQRVSSRSDGSGPRHATKPSLIGAVEFRWRQAVDKSTQLLAGTEHTHVENSISQHDHDTDVPSHGDPIKQPRAWYRRLWHSTCHMLKTLFPALWTFRGKPIWHWLFNILTAPTVFLLTITVPVVDREDHQNVPHESGHISSKTWDRWLMILQGFVTPQFVFAVVWLDGEGDATDLRSTLLYPSLYILAGSCLFAAAVLVSSNHVHEPQWYQFMSIAGFIASAVWISSIADEIVGILQALGVILGISETVLGFTVFAVGNSLDDLMADITVAQHGHPVMALAACYGGPMLNILLGVGVSGLYVILKDGGGIGAVELKADQTIFISIGTLVVTLLGLVAWMVWKGWRMTKKLGILLICVWVACTVANLVVALTSNNLV